jgi:hypothetical protein
LTYKKAIRLITERMKTFGFEVSKTAQKQVGYLALYATEGEVSKHMHHELKAILQHLPCHFEPGSLSDDVFMHRLDRYGKLLASENSDGGEISLGWLIREAEEKELWQVFSGVEI